MSLHEKRRAKIEACTVLPTSNGFDVHLPHGATYQVKRGARGWLYCSCPARARSCPHLAAVEQHLSLRTGELGIKEALGYDPKDLPDAYSGGFPEGR